MMRKIITQNVKWAIHILTAQLLLWEFLSEWLTKYWLLRCINTSCRDWGVKYRNNNVNIFIINGYGRFIFLLKFNLCDILSVLLSMERFPVYALIAVFYASYIVIYHEQMTFNDPFLSNIIFFFSLLKGIKESILISYQLPSLLHI